MKKWGYEVKWTIDNGQLQGFTISVLYI